MITENKVYEALAFATRDGEFTTTYPALIDIYQDLWGYVNKDERFYVARHLSNLQKKGFVTKVGEYISISPHATYGLMSLHPDGTVDSLSGVFYEYPEDFIDVESGRN